MEAAENYQCEECGLHYEDAETAEACYEFCSKNHACNLEISKHSIEYKKLQQQREDKELSGDSHS